MVLNTSGLDPDSIKLGLVGRTLKIEAVSKQSTASKDDNGQENAEEDDQRSFTANMILPEPVLTDQMRTRMSNGRLYITIPKANPPEPNQPESYPSSSPYQTS